jgi:DNA primase
VANTYFQEILWDAEEGRSIGLSYFKERELKDDIIRKFQLGYSPERRMRSQHMLGERIY